MSDDLKFLIPEAARKRMEQYYNVSKGDSSTVNFNRSLDLMGDNAPRLNENQRKALLEKASDKTKKNAEYYIDWIAERKAKKAAKGLPTDGAAIKAMERRLDLSIMADSMEESLPTLKGYQNVDPPTVFSDSRERKTIQGALQKLRDMKSEGKTPEKLRQKVLAERMRNAGMSVVKKAGPKLGAVLGGPIGMGIAAASTLMDAKDAYAGIESTMNPETEDERMRQHYLAELMRRGED